MKESISVRLEESKNTVWVNIIRPEKGEPVFALNKTYFSFKEKDWKKTPFFSLREIQQVAKEVQEYLELHTSAPDQPEAEGKEEAQK